MKKLFTIIALGVIATSIAQTKPALPYQESEVIEFPGSDFIHFIQNGKMGVADTVTEVKVLVEPIYDLVVPISYNEFMVLDKGLIKIYNSTSKKFSFSPGKSSLELLLEVDMGDQTMVDNEDKHYVFETEDGETGEWVSIGDKKGYGRPYITLMPASNNRYIVRINSLELEYVIDDEYGEPMFDELTGDAVYNVVGGIYTGIYNVSNDKWDVTAEHYNISLIDNGFLIEGNSGYSDYNKPKDPFFTLLDKGLKTLIEKKPIEKFTLKDTIAFLPKGSSVFSSWDKNHTYYWQNGKMGVFDLHVQEGIAKILVPAKYEYVHYFDPTGSFICYLKGRMTEEVVKERYYSSFKLPFLPKKSLNGSINPETGDVLVDIDGKIFEMERFNDTEVRWNPKGDINYTCTSEITIEKNDKLLINSNTLQYYEKYDEYGDVYYDEWTGDPIYEIEGSTFGYLFDLKTKAWLGKGYDNISSTATGYMVDTIRDFNMGYGYSI